jgi:hypothetical protein
MMFLGFGRVLDALGLGLCSLPASNIALDGASLGNAGRLTRAATQVVKLGAAHVAPAHDLDRIDDRRIEREDALDALAERNLADGEARASPSARFRSARAMQTPSNACTRVRSPSITLTPTRSVSPGRNSGTGLSLVSASIASRSRVSIRFIFNQPSCLVAARQRGSSA